MSTKCTVFYAGGVHLFREVLTEQYYIEIEATHPDQVRKEDIIHIYLPQMKREDLKTIADETAKFENFD